MAQESGPEPDQLREAIASTVARMDDSVTHPALALLRPLSAVFASDLETAHRELEGLAGHPDPWTRAARHIFLAFLDHDAGNVDRAVRTRRRPTTGSARSATAGG